MKSRYDDEEQAVAVAVEIIEKYLQNEDRKAYEELKEECRQRIRSCSSFHDDPAFSNLVLNLIDQAESGKFLLVIIGLCPVPKHRNGDDLASCSKQCGRTSNTRTAYEATVAPIQSDFEVPGKEGSSAVFLNVVIVCPVKASDKNQNCPHPTETQIGSRGILVDLAHCMKNLGVVQLTVDATGVGTDIESLMKPIEEIDAEGVVRDLHHFSCDNTPRYGEGNSYPTMEHQVRCCSESKKNFSDSVNNRLVKAGKDPVTPSIFERCCKDPSLPFVQPFTKSTSGDIIFSREVLEEVERQTGGEGCLKDKLIGYMKENAVRQRDVLIFNSGDEFVPQFVKQYALSKVPKLLRYCKDTFNVNETSLLAVGMLASFLGWQGMKKVCEMYDITPAELGAMGLEAVCEEYGLTPTELGAMGMEAVCAKHGLTSAELGAMGMEAVCEKNDITPAEFATMGMEVVCAKHGITPAELRVMGVKACREWHAARVESGEHHLTELGRKRSELAFPVRYQQLVQYKNKYGDCNVPASWKDSKLASFVQMMRVYYKNKQEGVDNPLTDHRQAKLEELGFEWSRGSNVQFAERLAQLLEYKEQHGDCKVPQRYKATPGLGKWVGTIRMYYKNKQNGDEHHLSDEREAKLRQMGFVFSVGRGNG